jgi:hypothetical protein
VLAAAGRPRCAYCTAMSGLLLLLGCSLSLLPRPALAQLSWSAGFSDDAVLQRSAYSEGKEQSYDEYSRRGESGGAAVYGFCTEGSAVTVAVSGTDGNGATVGYSVRAAISPWKQTSGCNSTACIDPRTPLPPAHGAFTFRATLHPHPAGGHFTITARSAAASEGANTTITLQRVTYGDVYFCSGQSNMALETYYTFSAQTLQTEIRAGKFRGLRHFMFGSMGNHFEALAPQWVTAQNSLSAGVEFVWHNVTASAALPLLDPATGQHSAFSQFSATCLYFGAELITAREAQGLESVPIGLIQSAIGGSQIE